ncbi:hypothetical protein D3C72_2152940 [compost metagenome]
MCGVRGHGDDRPALLATELAHRLLEQVKRPTNVYRKGLLPVVLRQPIGCAHAQNSRRIDQHVQTFNISQ